MAFATGRPMAAVWRAPYRETLREFLHLQQQDRLASFRHRGDALHAASLLAIAFHDPKKLADEHQRLLRDAGLVAVIDNDTARANALAFIAEIEQADANGSWREVTL